MKREIKINIISGSLFGAGVTFAISSEFKCSSLCFAISAITLLFHDKTNKY